jgi:hypothetical protein
LNIRAYLRQLGYALIEASVSRDPRVLQLALELLERAYSQVEWFRRLNPDFHFHDLPDNFLASPDAFIHAGFNVMKALRRSTLNG